MTVSHRPNVPPVTAQWAEADKLRIAWERAEAAMLHAAREVIVSKTAAGNETPHILEKMSLDEAQAGLQRARQRASEAYQAWHGSLDAFLSGAIEAASATETPHGFSRRGIRRSCSSRSASA